MGSPCLGTPASALIVEFGAALSLLAGVAFLLLQDSRGGRITVSSGGLIGLGGFAVGGVREYHGTLRAPPTGQPLARFGTIVVKISRS
jgi:hypothetical protein